MPDTTIAEAHKDLTTLVTRTAAGEDVVLVGEDGSRVRLVPASSHPKTLRLGRLEGRFSIPDDFHDPLPDDLLDEFERPF
jgi:antitoxin (DNA-binding transcriptional repressor) of toxin-antitoxin stability system